MGADVTGVVVHQRVLKRRRDRGSGIRPLLIGRRHRCQRRTREPPSRGGAKQGAGARSSVMEGQPDEGFPAGCRSPKASPCSPRYLSPNLSRNGGAFDKAEAFRGGKKFWVERQHPPGTVAPVIGCRTSAPRAGPIAAGEQRASPALGLVDKPVCCPTTPTRTPTRSRYRHFRAPFVVSTARDTPPLNAVAHTYTCLVLTQRRHRPTFYYYPTARCYTC